MILPVTNGTPVPDLPYEIITAENVARLQQLARYGYPLLLYSDPIRLTADGKTLVVGTTLGLEFYDAHTQTKTGGFEVEFLRSFDMTPDGQYFLTLVGETLIVWRRDGKKVREFNLPFGEVWYLSPMAISPDGSLVALQRKKVEWQEVDKVDVYRVQDGILLDTVRGNGVMFSPDGKYLVTVFDGSLRLYPVAELGQGWEKRLPKQALSWCGWHEDVSCELVFSADGSLVAIIRPSRVDVYQVADRRLVREVSGWETGGYTTMPKVQFADQVMLITTPAVYDRPFHVKVKPGAIVVDIPTGQWLNKVTNLEKDIFAYLERQVSLSNRLVSLSNRLVSLSNRLVSLSNRLVSLSNQPNQVRTFRWQTKAFDLFHFGVLLHVDDNGRVNLADYSHVCQNETCEPLPGNPAGEPVEPAGFRRRKGKAIGQWP